MGRKTSGSRYVQKIDAITYIIAYEGDVDEKEYFDSVAIKIQKRFEKLIQVIPVEKSSTNNSDPASVLRDLSHYCSKNAYDLKNSSVTGFIVIDRDRYFTGTHLTSTTTALTEARQKKVKVVVSNPSFDLWGLLHFEDLSLLSPNDSQALLENKKTSGNTFAKRRLRACKGQLRFSDLPDRIETALENAAKLDFDKQNPTANIGTNMPDLINELKAYF